MASAPLLLTTDQFLTQVAPKGDYSKDGLAGIAGVVLSLAKAHYDHPVAAKAMMIFLLAIGVTLLATLPGTGSLANWVVPTVSSVGSLDIVICLVALGAIGLAHVYVPLHHSMKKHAYTPAESTEQINGTITYEGDVPIFTIYQAENREAAGKTYGYLAAKSACDLFRKMRLSLQYRPFFTGAHTANEVDAKFLASIKSQIPDEYLQEIKGYVQGHNEWCNDPLNNRAEDCVTEDEIILFNLIADSTHLELPKQSLVPAAMCCTALVAKDAEQGMVFARNLDWPTNGFLGSYTCVVKRVFSNGRTTCDVGTPGVLGVLSGMNESGFCVAMNSAASVDPMQKTVNGMPAVFYNRHILENCNSTVDVATYVQQKKAKQPLGPYHLTCVDENTATAIHFFQGVNRKHFCRDLTQEYILTTNPYYKNKNVTRWMLYGQERTEKIAGLFEDAQQKVEAPEMGKIAEHALSLPIVNNPVTAHSMIFHPRAKEMSLAFDESYAATVPKTHLSKEVLFGRKNTISET